RRHTRCLSDWSSDVCSSDLTYTQPDGRLRYTINGSQWLSTPSRGARGGPRDVRIANYLVRGRVVDVEGRPIDGAAVRIGREAVRSEERRVGKGGRWRRRMGG